MGKRTLRDRLSDLWWDIRHPIATMQRETTLRYCERTNQVLSPAPHGYYR
jgi:hypothetical protein